MYVISKNYPYSESLEVMAKKEALENEKVYFCNNNLFNFIFLNLF